MPKVSHTIQNQIKCLVCGNLHDVSVYIDPEVPICPDCLLADANPETLGDLDEDNF